MQQYAMTRCVAMVKKMIGQTRLQCLLSKTACLHTAAATQHTHIHTLTHVSAEIGWLIAVV